MKTLSKENDINNPVSQRILLIDDDADLLKMLATFLTRKGFVVVTARDGNQGLQLAVTHRPDLIICDLEMPSLDGFEVIARLRSEIRFREIPLIVFSGNTSREQIRQSINLGGDDFLYKPAPLVEILAAIQARLERVAQINHLQARRVSQVLDLFGGLVNDLGGENLPARWRATVTTFLRRESPALADLILPQLGEAYLPLKSPAPLPPVQDRGFLSTGSSRQEYVKLSQVKAFLAESEYSIAHWGDGQKMMFRKSLKEWLRELPPNVFVRIHRSAIINLHFFQHWDQNHSGRRQAHLRGFPDPIEISVRSLPNLKRSLVNFQHA